MEFNSVLKDVFPALDREPCSQRSSPSRDLWKDGVASSIFLSCRCCFLHCRTTSRQAFSVNCQVTSEPFSCMHLVRASYVPKRKLPYPSACCLYCPITVCGTRGSREQHQVAALSRQGTVALTVVVGHLLTS